MITAAAALVVLGALFVADVLELPASDQNRDLANQNEVIEEEPGRLLQRPQRPQSVNLVREGEAITVTWESQPAADGYVVVRYSSIGEPIDAVSVEESRAVLKPGPDGSLCVEVQAAIGAQRSTPSPRRCA